MLSSWENLRTNLIKDLRNHLKEDSRIFMGKNSLVRIAFGTSKDQAYLPGLDKLANEIRGNVGLLFTNRDASKIEEFIEQFSKEDYARAGTIAAETLELEAGPIKCLPGNMYEELRRLHLPVVLKKGVLELEKKFAICKKGEELTPEQAQLLKLFENKIANFRLVLTHRYRQGEFTQLNAMIVDQDSDGY